MELKEIVQQKLNQIREQFFGSGFLIAWKMAGSSNLRDALGLFPDHYLDPVNYVDGFEERIAISGQMSGSGMCQHIGEYESLKKDAVDLYTFFRDGYEQRRAKQIED